MRVVIALLSVLFGVANVGQASFISANSNMKVAEVSGVFTRNAWVNTFSGGNLVTSNGTFASSNTSYITDLGVKTFKMVIVAPMTNSQFSFTATGTILGVVASTQWAGQTPNGSGSGQPLVGVWNKYSDLESAFSTALGLQGLNPLNDGFFTQSYGSGTGAARGIEIHRAGASGNPDSINLTGNTFTVDVNAFGSGNGELFAVLFEVPEPTTMALWGVGAAGLAFVRFRRRK